MRLRLLAIAMLLSWSAAAHAADSDNQYTFAFHGFVGGSLYGQDAHLGPSPGAQPMWVDKTLSQDKLSLGGDIRQTRLNFSLAGPKVLGGATPKAVVEIDFFGGNSSGGFGDVSVFPRMREAYAELAWDNTTIQVGQQYSLVLGVSTVSTPFLPASVGHIAFPVTYAAGTIGWRYPGIYMYERIPVGSETKLELALEVARSAWANPANPAEVVGSSVNFFSDTPGLGEASGLPQIEARAMLANKMFQGFVTGHWSSVDPTGDGVSPIAGAACTPGTLKSQSSGCGNVETMAVNGGLRGIFGPLTIQGAGYVGQNTAPLLGEIVQFQNLANGDVKEWGAWGQAGYNFTPELSLWGLIGTERLDTGDAARAFAGNANARWQNTSSQGMLQYAEKGYKVGLEFTHWLTRTLGNGNLNGNQLMASAFYFF